MGRLNNKDFKRFKELEAKGPNRTEAENKEFDELKSRKLDKSSGNVTFRPGNDFAWWSKEPVLLKDAVNLPLNWIPGTALVPGAQTESGKPGTPSSVLAVYVQNTYGSENSSTEPFNLTARGLYLAMHRKYRGLNAYQAADIGMVLIATIELFSLIASIERIYGVINRYDILNRNLPYALLAAMDVTDTLADNIRDNLSDFRYGINNLIKKAQNVCIPKDLSVLADKIALFGYVYKDHDSPKAQSIVFVMNEVGQYTGDAADTGGGVVFKDASFSDFTTYDQILSVLRETIDALVEDSDVLRIYSDFVSYLPAGSLMTLLPVPEEYVVIPVYSEEILHKIHNAYTTGSIWEVDAEGETYGMLGDETYVRELVPNGITPKTGLSKIEDRAIFQKDNVIHTKSCLFSSLSGGNVTSFTSGVLDGYTAWQFDASEVLPSAHFGNRQLFDTYRHEADPATMLEGCLFKFVPSWIPVQKVAYVQSCAWEVITSFNVITTVNGTVKDRIKLHQFLYTNGYDTNLPVSILRQQDKIKLQSAGFIGQYDWAPFLYNVEDDDVNSIFYNDVLPFIGDMDNCRMVGYNDIFRMHEVAMYSGIATSATVTTGGNNE